eukprot:scaffold34652_cov211-Amphora_coffeaeformis.AAC.10
MSREYIFWSRAARACAGSIAQHHHYFLQGHLSSPTSRLHPVDNKKENLMTVATPTIYMVETFAKDASPPLPSKRGKWMMMILPPSKEVPQRTPAKQAWHQKLTSLLGRREKVKEETTNETQTSRLTWLPSSLDNIMAESSLLVGLTGNSWMVLFVSLLLLAVAFLVLCSNTRAKKHTMIAKETFSSALLGADAKPTTDRVKENEPSSSQSAPIQSAPEEQTDQDKSKENAASVDCSRQGDHVPLVPEEQKGSDESKQNDMMSDGSSQVDDPVQLIAEEQRSVDKAKQTDVSTDGREETSQNELLTEVLSKQTTSTADDENNNVDKALATTSRQESTEIDDEVDAELHELLAEIDNFRRIQTAAHQIERHR